MAAKFHESTTVEILWTIVPFIILVAMAVPATATLIKIYDASEPDIDIQITGYQWKWHYKYLGQDVEFFSNLATPADQIHNKAAKGEHYLLEVDKPLVLPMGAKVRFLVTSADVIHSWWVPAFAVKRDAIPGFVNEAWTRVEKPGIYRGPVRRAVRQGPRLHADRGRGQVQGRLRQPGWPNARPRPPSSRN